MEKNKNSIVGNMKSWMLFSFLITIAGNGCTFDPVAPTLITKVPPAEVAVVPYQHMLTRVDSQRKSLASLWKCAADKEIVLQHADSLLTFAVLNDIAPYWYGTPWDFNGVTQMPGEGKIACGYLVTTILRDAGFNLQRVALAQQASENIVKSLTTSTIHRYRRYALVDFIKEIKNQGRGLYVVGLDNHVGFLIHDGVELWFVHASFVSPSVVIKEPAATSPVLNATNYRVTGKLTGDKELLKKWLQDIAIATVKK